MEGSTTITALSAAGAVHVMLESGTRRVRWLVDGYETVLYRLKVVAAHVWLPIVGWAPDDHMHVVWLAIRVHHNALKSVTQVTHLKMT